MSKSSLTLVGVVATSSTLAGVGCNIKYSRRRRLQHQGPTSHEVGINVDSPVCGDWNANELKVDVSSNHDCGALVFIFRRLAVYGTSRRH